MISEKDVKIISCLRSDARQALATIARKLNIPVSTVYDRIKSNEKKLIKKYTSIVDFPKLGYNIRIKMMLDINDKKGFQDFVLENANVNSAFKVDGNYSFMLDCIFRQMREVSAFMDAANKFGITSKQMFFVVDELKREEFLNVHENVRD